MVTSELLDFLRVQLNKGVQKERLTQVLLAEGGWSQADLSEAFAALRESSAPLMPPLSKQVKEVATVVTPATSRSSDPSSGISRSIPPPSPSPQQPRTHLEPATRVLHLQEGEDFLGIFTNVMLSVAEPISPPPSLRSAVDPSLAATAREQKPLPTIRPAPRPVAPVDAKGAVVTQQETLDAYSGAQVSPIGTADIQSPARGTVPAAQRATPPPRPTMNPPIASEVRKVPAQQVVSTPRYGEVPATISTRQTPTQQIRPSSAFVPSRSKTVEPSGSAVARAATPSQPPSTVMASTQPSSPNIKVPPPVPSIAARVPQIRPVAPAAPEAAPTRRDVADTGVLPEPRQVTGPQRISKIAPPKRTLQDLLAQLQGQVPDTSSKKVASQPSSAHSAPAERPSNGEDRLTTVVLSKTETTDRSREQELQVPASVMAKTNIFRILIAIVAVLLLGAVVFGYAYFFRGEESIPDIRTQLSEATSFTYLANIRSVLNFSDQGGRPAGEFSVSADASGKVLSGENGFSDGEHRVKFSGDYEEGTNIWATEINGDVRVVGSSLYFLAEQAPENGNIDPVLLKNNWIVVDLSDVAKELSMQGAELNTAYGGFLGQGKDRSFLGILLANYPFVGVSDREQFTTSNEDTWIKYRLKLDPQKTTVLVQEMAKLYFGKDLVSPPGEEVRLEDAWKRVEVYVYIGKGDGVIKRFQVIAPLNDEIFAVRVRGTISVDVTITALSEPVLVSAPSTALTMEQVTYEMERYKTKRGLIEADKERVRTLDAIESSLKRYFVDKKRYPAQLSELLGDGQYALESASTTLVREFVYYGYKEIGKYSKGNRCTFKGATCPEYHLGIDLSDRDNPALDVDRDVFGEIKGTDATGCSGAEGYACLDRTASPVSLPTAAATSTLPITEVLSP